MMRVGRRMSRPMTMRFARAMAEEEAMIEMTEDCPYQAILELMNVIADSQFAAEAARFVMRGTGIPKKFRLLALFSTVITSEHFQRKKGPYTGLPVISARI